ncbi:hypothetical protein Tco_0849438 [Tanacetum coccineum]
MARLDQTLVYKMKARLDQTLVMLQSLNLNQVMGFMLDQTENLKLLTEDQVILKEPARSTRTLSSLQNLDKDLSFTDQFFVEKPHEEEPRKTNAEAEAMQAPLQARFRDLLTVDMKEILQQQMFEDNTYKTHEVHNDLYEALQKSMELDYSNQRLADQEEARKMKRKRRDSPITPPGSPPTQPPPPPPPASTSSAPAQQQGTKAPSSSKTAASALQSMAWTTSDTQYESANIPEAQELSPTDYLLQDDSIPEEQVYFSNDEDS